MIHHPSVFVSVVVCLSTGLTQAQPALFAWRNSQTGDGPGLYLITPSGPGAERIGFSGLPEFVQVPEIEYAEGIVYAFDTEDRGKLYEIDPDTGALLGELSLAFPMGAPSSPVIVAMEYAEGVMYANMTSMGGGAGSTLVEIDLATGGVTIIGSITGTGSSMAIVGLAWDGQTMFACQGGNAAPTLYELDLGTGATTLVGDLMLEGAVSPRITGIEFGPDGGPLYATPVVEFGISGDLHVLSRHTARSVNLGDTGQSSLVALTSRDSEPDPGCTEADIVEPFGTLNFNDVIAYLTRFSAGCP